MPAFPMDGGRVLRALPAHRLWRRRGTQIAASVGQGMAILFGLLGLLFNPFLIFIAFFVYIGAQGEAQMVEFNSLIRGLTVRDGMQRRFRALAASESLSVAVTKLLAGAQQDFPVVANGQVAGVQDADAVVVSIGENMQGSILTTLLLKELRVKKLICRALDDKHATVLEKLGADLVVLPSRDMAYRLAERLRDNVGGDRQGLSGDYQLAQIQLGPALHGKTLAAASLRERYRVTLVLLTRGEAKGEAKAFEPAPELKLLMRDLLFVAGRRENLNRFERECGPAE